MSPFIYILTGPGNAIFFAFLYTCNYLIFPLELGYNSFKVTSDKTYKNEDSKKQEA